MTVKNHSNKTARIKDVAELDPETLGESTAPSFTFKYIDLSSVKGGRIGEHVELMTFAAAPGRARKLVKDGDILLGMVRPYLKPFAKVQSAFDGHVASTGFAVIRAKTDVTDPEYLYQTIWSDGISKQIHQMVTGSNYPALSVGDVRDLKVPLPPLAEQRKIAEILRTWDEAIETAEAELKAKQERKRWLMDRLFKFSPESHLEQVKMKDAVDVLKGEQLNRHTLAEKGSYPVWNGGITPSGYTESYNTEGPAVIMSEGGNSCGAITRVNGNFWRGGHCYHVVPRNGFSNDYLFAALKYYEPQIMRLRVGSGLPNIQKKTLLSWGAPLHKPAYRDKVATVFSLAQYEDELSRDIIETLRSQKRGLMQKLLTGEIVVK
jgi:type I restriction enzyme S subunit